MRHEMFLPQLMAAFGFLSSLVVIFLPYKHKSRCITVCFKNLLQFSYSSQYFVLVLAIFVNLLHQKGKQLLPPVVIVSPFGAVVNCCRTDCRQPWRARHYQLEEGTPGQRCNCVLNAYIEVFKCRSNSFRLLTVCLRMVWMIVLLHV